LDKEEIIKIIRLGNDPKKRKRPKNNVKWVLTIFKL
jgi:hypothetical protein